MMEADFEERELEILRDIVSRMGLADVRAFDMTWEDCEVRRTLITTKQGDHPMTKLVAKGEK